MPRRPSGRPNGRPSKGDRKVIYSRVPRAIADMVEAEAAQADLPYCDVVANALAAHYGLPPVVVPTTKNQMPLIA